MGPGMGGRGRGSQRYGPGYGPPPPEYGPHADSPVLMVYGLEPSKVNADKVFNIFCLYGNVERVSGMKLSIHHFAVRHQLLIAAAGALNRSLSTVIHALVLCVVSWLWFLPQVKFMKSKPGAAMVEMGDCYSVDRAITHLNNNFLFGQKLNVW